MHVRAQGSRLLREGGLLKQTQLGCTTVHRRASPSGDPGPASKNSVQVTAPYFQKKKIPSIRSTALPNQTKVKPWSPLQGTAGFPEAPLVLQVIPCTGDDKERNTPSTIILQPSSVLNPLQSWAGALCALPVSPLHPSLSSQISTEALGRRACVKEKRQLQLRKTKT